MIGAAAMIGAAIRAPLSGLALVLELTHSGLSLMARLDLLREGTMDGMPFLFTS